MFKFLKDLLAITTKSSSLIHKHVYYYSGLDCTVCGERYLGLHEPEYTSHFVINVKLTPKKES